MAVFHAGGFGALLKKCHSRNFHDQVDFGSVAADQMDLTLQKLCDEL